MASITIDFDTDNDAFRDEDGTLILEAVADALQGVVRKLRDYRTDGPVMDGNGNTVGTFALTEED